MVSMWTADYLKHDPLFFHVTLMLHRLSFLGVPVGANPRRRETWKPVVEALSKRLSSWNG
jgi:hypothetical protein